MASALRTIFHVDMDAFFASVELRDDPSLRGKPVLVGGEGRRGVVAAASYEARRFGCHSAQPMAVALRRCPHAVVLPPRFDAYSEASAQVFEVFDRFSPLVEGLSIDEAFLDMTGTERLLGPPRTAAEALRSAVRQRTQLTCSVGISAVKFIAKLASAIDKPDGLTEVLPGTELEFLATLPIGKLWGVGDKTEARLREHGVRTVGDLRRISADALQRMFGEHGLHLHALAHARDDREVIPGRERKQVSHEDTYAVDVVGEEALRRKLLSQATRVADRLTAKGIGGRKVQLKIRDIDFRTETRQCTLPEPTSEARVIYDAVCRLLQELELAGRRFRLTGVGVGQLQDVRAPRQLDLLAAVEPPAEARGQRLQGVLSEVRRKFGHQALYPAEAGSNEREGSAGGFTTTLEED
ncbi:DNA polymerase IV [Paraliomyxa miuraensis]|uniref:DNA polymerase IV n=1 Tax=Paraliomyxa miuraensis TaxID=376150 RepID=UPI002256834E|nr:DNA polymerase IV [Paraliomyxa miuraensis]MCX4246102.1 DNA polymerase IV [Paraliomyxa miuraensis]